MRIAVLSGKGGTGKTFLSVNIASAAKEAVYVDCDVEEPNGRIYFKPHIISAETVTQPLPQVDQSKCNGCERCVDFCKFNALAYTGDKLMVFTQLCHSCGGCLLVCPTKAFTEIPKTLGQVYLGVKDKITVLSAEMKIGEASETKLVQKLLENSKTYKSFTFIDCPPGTGCLVTESIRDADYAVLVAEPTLFGAHNLKLVYDLVTLYEIPFGIIINKSTGEENPTLAFCRENNLPIIAEIPYDKKMGEENSKGKILAEENPKWEKFFSKLLNTIYREAKSEKTAGFKR